MTLRNYRPLVVLATLALSSCPLNFKYGVENGEGQAVASVGAEVAPAVASPQYDAGPRRPPGG